MFGKTSVKLITFFLLLSVQAFAIAQEACSALVERALSEVGTACAGLARNSACYGFNRVDAQFAQAVAEDFFTQVADVAPLADIALIQTAPLNEAAAEWGVAVLSLQANIPNSLPGQAVNFVLMGDVELESAVAPEDAFTPAEPIAVEVVQGANLRSGPSTSFNVVSTALAGDVLQADGLSADGAWLRISNGATAAWIFADLVRPSADVRALPVLDGTQRLPMQAFYLRTGIGASECEAAPQDTLLVQGPKNIQIELTVNGANVKLGSTVLFRNIAEDTMEIIVLDGEAVVEGQNGEPPTIIAAGFRSEVCLDPPENRGTDGEANDRLVSCAPSEPQEVPPDALGGDWCVLQNVATANLQYPVDLQCPGEPEPTPEPAQATSTPNTSERGNDDNIIYDNALLDCSGFALVAPLGQVFANSSTYSWTEVPGADFYRLFFWREDNTLAAQSDVPAGQTSTSIAIGDLPVGGAPSWQVAAFKGDALVCATARSGTLFVELPPPVVIVNSGGDSSGGGGTTGGGPAPAFSATCSMNPSNGIATFTWNNANPTESLAFKIKNGVLIEYMSITSGVSGTVSVDTGVYKPSYSDVKVYRSSIAGYFIIGSCP